MSDLIPDPIPVTPEGFANRFWKRYTDHGFAASWGQVPLGLEELAQVAALMPIVFDAEAKPVILLRRSEDGAGDYIDPNTGLWRLPYTPAALRAYPFDAVPHPGGMAVMFDANSGLTSGVPTDEPFFLPGGDIAPPLAAVIAFLQARAATYGAAQAAGRALAEADLLVPLVPRGHLSPARAQGFQQVDRARLEALTDAALPGLFRAHALRLAEAHLVSLQHCDRKIAVAQDGEPYGHPGGERQTDESLSGFLDALAAAQD